MWLGQCDETLWWLSATNEREVIDFSLVNFPFLSSNIPSAPAYAVNPLCLSLHKVSGPSCSKHR